MTEPARDSKESVGPYRILRAIGAGGSARIDLARIDRAYNFQRHVVVKRPLEHLRGEQAVSTSLRREARIGGMLRHPNLVAVLDAGVHDNYDYLVLEYIHGTSLRTLMQPDGATSGKVREVPLAVALGIAIDVARGLHEAHELIDDRGSPLGLVHRDVSPGNVLLGVDGAVKLADFGIAKETRVATLSGSMHGTVTYMAPEQCRGHAFDRRADLFSIGVILYELLTRQRLFWADNDVASLHRVLSGQVVRPRKIDPAISPALEEIVMTAVANDPLQRFESARLLGDALEALAAAEGHVVGARLLARTLEEVVGVKHAPWIASTTIVEMHAAVPVVEPMRVSEPSLVEVIANLAPVDDAEPIYPTFGPSDERALEEGSIPSAPILARTAAPERSRSRIWLPVGAVLVLVAGAGLGIFAVTHNGDDAVPPAPVVTPHVPSPPPSPPVAPITHEALHATEVVDVAPHPTPVQTPHHQQHTRKPKHQTNPTGAGSDANAVLASQPPSETASAGSAATAAGSGARLPSNVEWKPTIFLPSDSGSGNKKKP